VERDTDGLQVIKRRAQAPTLGVFQRDSNSCIRIIFAWNFGSPGISLLVQLKKQVQFSLRTLKEKLAQSLFFQGEEFGSNQALHFFLCLQSLSCVFAVAVTEIFLTCNMAGKV
jgi:hypothetical protein